MYYILEAYIYIYMRYIVGVIVLYTRGIYIYMRYMVGVIVLYTRGIYIYEIYSRCYCIIY